ncbi:MAG: DUF393 domain-containing protein [Granulosicoccaceae bacterium]
MTNDATGKPDPIRVFYNSACPVCNAGIKSQRGKTSDSVVVYEDVYLNNQLAEQLNAPLALVRERLHVVDEHQQVQLGLDAFITIWRHSPKERWKAKLFSLPGIYAVAVVGYKLFARGLYRWNQSKNHW